VLKLLVQNNADFEKKDDEGKVKSYLDNNQKAHLLEFVL